MENNVMRKFVVIATASIGVFGMMQLAGCKGAPAYPLCKNDSHCKTGTAGESLNGVCVNGTCQACAMNSDCQNGDVCVENACVASTLPKKDSSMSSSFEDECTLDKSTVYFDFDQYEIKSDNSADLNRIAKCMIADEQARLVLEGNTDERGSSEYNLALGQRRADAVAKFLSNNGVMQNRLKTVSYGKERPVDTESNEDAWAKNRRAEIKTQ